MKIQKIGLYNFRSGSKIDFEFTTNLNLFVGVNGSGKSTILDALSLCLSWLIQRIEQEDGEGAKIPDSSLRLGQETGFLEIDVHERDKNYHWLLSKTEKGRSSNKKSQLKSVAKLAEVIQENYKQNQSWPVIVYYPVNRVVGEIRPEIPDDDSINNLDVYNNALDGKTNYQSFFEWFRHQDDILNERDQSLPKWMRRNQGWIESQITLLLASLKEATLENDEIISNGVKYFDPDPLQALLQLFEKEELFYEEPGGLFSELAFLINREEAGLEKDNGYVGMLSALGALCDKMNTFSHRSRTHSIDIEIRYILASFEAVKTEGEIDERMIRFLWESLVFSIQFSLWWLSDQRKIDLEQILQEGESTALFSSLEELVKKELQRQKDTHSNQGQELQVVTKAIERFIPGYQNLRIKRVPRPHMGTCK